MDDEFASTVAVLLDAYDLEGLQALAQASLTPERKELLAERGLLALASIVEYDIACRKGFPGAAEFMLACVEAAEALLDRPLYLEKGSAYLARLEQGDLASGRLALDAFSRAAPPPRQRMAYVHSLLAQHEEPLAHWSEALHLAQEVPDAERNWDFFLSLLYESTAGEEPELGARRRAAIVSFEARPPTQTFSDVMIAKAYQGLLAREPARHDRDDLLDQLAKRREHAVRWDFLDAPIAQLREAGHFFEQGALPRASEVYAHLLERTATPGLEVTYLAGALEKRGLLEEALRSYQRHSESIFDDLSAMIHYAEFLARLYANHGSPLRPARATVEAVARRAATLGGGHYSAPGLVLAKVALLDGDEAAARFELTRLLLLHELLIETPMERLRDEVTLPDTRAFLEATCAFMREVSPDYYFEMRIRWSELEPLDPAQVDALWTARMAALRTRAAR